MGTRSEIFVSGSILKFRYTVNSNLRMRVWQSKDRLFATDAVHWSKSAKVFGPLAIPPYSFPSKVEKS